ncbi:hypothetical protein BS47DRAFT_1389480 [Hydnum rufescens UP504]|uniref:Uncharacterized protein n=1 Tax=Hydnum rufescens UP504 TaxID=1448309 RepID=A0A9P6B4V1_9AGAM|nr:hypothetical protein BS47DRAFT_1389480 [Hydnum rufescens UP504]
MSTTTVTSTSPGTSPTMPSSSLNAEQQAAEALVAVGRYPSHNFDNSHHDLHQDQGHQNSEDDPAQDNPPHDSATEEQQQEPKRKRPRKSKTEPGLEKDVQESDGEKSANLHADPEQNQAHLRALEESQQSPHGDRGDWRSREQGQFRLDGRENQVDQNRAQVRSPHFLNDSEPTSRGAKRDHSGERAEKQGGRILVDEDESRGGQYLPRPPSSMSQQSSQPTPPLPISSFSRSYQHVLPHTILPHFDDYRQAGTGGYNGARLGSGIELPPIDSYMGRPSSLSRGNDREHDHHHKYPTPPRPSSSSSSRHTHSPHPHPVDALPTRTELERHYTLLKDERKRLEQMVSATDRMLDGVKRALDMPVYLLPEKSEEDAVPGAVRIRGRQGGSRNGNLTSPVNLPSSVARRAGEPAHSRPLPVAASAALPVCPRAYIVHAQAFAFPLVFSSSSLLPPSPSSALPTHLTVYNNTRLLRRQRPV